MTDTSFFDDLRAGLLEGTAHFRGEAELKVTTMTAPNRQETAEQKEAACRPTHPRFSERVQAGLLKTLAYARGDLELPTIVLTRPDPPEGAD